MKKLQFETSKNWEMLDITDMVQDNLSPDYDGFCLVFCPHTSATLLVGEKEEKLLEDYERVCKSLFEGSRPFLHSRHGHLTGEAHTFCFFHGFELLIPVEKGKLFLGRLQRIFFIEPTSARPRELWLYEMV